MNNHLKFLSIAAALSFVTVAAHASSCCGTQDSEKPAETQQSSVNATVETPQRGFFARLFSRSSTEPRAECSESKSECCPAKKSAYQASTVASKDKDESKCGTCPANASAYQAVLVAEKGKDESKSDGCCPAQAASMRQALVNGDCSDKSDCGEKRACPKPAAVVASDCDSDKAKDKDCGPCTRAASAPLATVNQ